jgi:hypothetical protein
LGAVFTTTLTAMNTVVIAALYAIHPTEQEYFLNLNVALLLFLNSVNSNKAVKAREWNIPIANHIWLEELFR